MKNNIFGEKKVFAIEYSQLKNPHGEIGMLGDSWGTLRLWCDEIDLLQAESCRDEINTPYQWNICYIAEWFAKNLNSIISEEDFPEDIFAKNAVEFHKRYHEIMPDMEDEWEEFSKWHKKIYNWNQRHWFRLSADSSLLPNLFLRAHGDKVELSWDNEGWYDDEGVKYKSIIGCEYVDKKYFQWVVLAFLKDFSGLFAFKYPKEFREHESLASLWHS